MKKKLDNYEGKEEDAEYYNTHPSPDLTLNVGWRNLYDKAAALLPANTNVKIADLGCGPGFFARILYAKGYRRYWGVDFSWVCIKTAQKAVPQFDFTIDSLYSGCIHKRFADYDVFILLETLEHLKEDIEVLRAIPSGKKIILSVPSVGGIGHVRRFRTVKSVYLRYDALVDLKIIWGLTSESLNKRFWLGHGVRK